MDAVPARDDKKSRHLEEPYVTKLQSGAHMGVTVLRLDIVKALVAVVTQGSLNGFEASGLDVVETIGEDHGVLHSVDRSCACAWEHLWFEGE